MVSAFITLSLRSLTPELILTAANIPVATTAPATAIFAAVSISSGVNDLRLSVKEMGIKTESSFKEMGIKHQDRVKYKSPSRRYEGGGDQVLISYFIVI